MGFNPNPCCHYSIDVRSVTPCFDSPLRCLIVRQSCVIPLSACKYLDPSLPQCLAPKPTSSGVVLMNRIFFGVACFVLVFILSTCFSGMWQTPRLHDILRINVPQHACIAFHALRSPVDMRVANSPAFPLRFVCVFCFLFCLLIL